MAPPVAAFIAGPLSGTAPLTVTFTDQSTGSPATWSWDFGDGGTSTSQNPSHTYGRTGIYNITFTATNAGGSDTMTRTGYVTVSAPAQTGSSGGSSTTGATAAAAASRLAPGEEVQFTFQNPAMPVRSVTFTSGAEIREVLVTTIERSIPAGIPPPEFPVYRYVDIQTYHLPEDAITGAVIAFQVPRSWVSSQEAEPLQVVLLRYGGDAWDQLPTEFLGAANGNLRYRSPTPGFSLFAIGVNMGREPPEPEEPAMTATTVPTPMPGGTLTPSVSQLSTPPPSGSEPSSSSGSPLHTVILIGAVVVLAVAVVAWRYTLPRPIRRNRGGWL
ncbi:MAG: PGF-pre-PGF domain-containing protein [Methanomicrobiales archaeon]|nr:PGF-pre-PGF domain-containing protein [Methanomicrobiales archaeon]